MTPAHAQDVPVAEPAPPPYTDAAEFTVLNLVNLFRLDHGLLPLEWDNVLTDLARERSADMIDRNYFGHDIPGVGFAPVWEQQQLAGGPGTGENLGATTEPNDAAVWSLFDSWVASPTHLENLLRPEFRRIGVGVVEAPTQFPNVSIKVVTQVFATSSAPLRRI